MGRKVNAYLSTGVKGQLSLENFELQNKLLNQKRNIDNVLNSNKSVDSDFYVGPNGKTLPKEYKSWIGKNKRQKFLNKVKNPTLKNAISEMYRKDSFIGDGGTASVLLFERKTGIGLGRNGGTHEKKARDMIKHIQRKILTQKLSDSDRKIANRLLKKLRKALVR